MVRITLHPDAGFDLRRMMEGGSLEREAAGRIAALLQQIKADPVLLDKLTDHDFGAKASAAFHVQKWLAFWNCGYDIWRLKVWEIPRGSLPYRVVYAFEPRRMLFHVLAVVHRDFNYDPRHTITKRILRAYEDLGLDVHR